MPVSTSSSSPGVQAANELYTIISALYTALNAAGVQISGVTITEPAALQQQVLKAVQAIQQA